MANDRKEELDRLEKELLSGIEEEDDLLADIPIELLDTTPATWEDAEEIQQEDPQPVTEVEPETEPENKVYTGKYMKKKPTKKQTASQKREDRFLTVLMAIASFLCLGIIGVLIYWLEAFLQ